MLCQSTATARNPGDLQRHFRCGIGDRLKLRGIDRKLFSYARSRHLPASPGKAIGNLQRRSLVISLYWAKQKTQMTEIAFFKHGTSIRLPDEQWDYYDAEADVLYIDFYNPPKSASDSELSEEDIVVRYDDDEIVGLTVLNASQSKAFQT